MKKLFFIITVNTFILILAGCMSISIIRYDDAPQSSSAPGTAVSWEN
jgi:hypothetical protein